MQSMAGVLRTEVDGNSSSELRGKPGRDGSTFHTVGTARVLACNLDILDMGRLKWENLSLAPGRSSPNVRPRSSDEGCTKSAAQMPHGAREEGAARGWHMGLEGPWAGLRSQNEGSQQRGLCGLSSEGRV